MKVDSKHRIVLPEGVRRKSGVKTGTKLRVSISGSSIVLAKNIEPEGFIERMEGFLKKGSTVPVASPLKLKEIWAKH